MTAKTYQAENMMSALKQIQTEMGPEAIVVSMRQIPAGPAWQVWRKPGCEVVAMPRTEQPENQTSAEPHAAAFAPAANKAETHSTNELDHAGIANAWPAALPHILPELPRRESKVMRAQPDVKLVQEAAAAVEKIMPEALAPAHHALAVPTAVANMRKYLLAQGVADDLIKPILSNCAQTLPLSALEDENHLRTYVRRQLEASLRVTSRAVLAPPSQVMVLIGPSGSGKTSTCAKLAAFYTYSLGKKVSWISADTVRTAAIAEARTYSDALGLPLRLTYTPNEMSDAIEEQEGADLVLIDTPGCNPRQEDRVVELGSFLTRIPNRGTYLVAAATTKETDINQALASFGPFHVKGMIVTKTDETTTFGSIYNIAAHTQTALTFFTSGDQVIGNLRAANSSDLVDAIFKGKFNA